MDKSVVLLSAGLDSTVNFYLALKKTSVVKVITFNYGQRAAFKEIEKSRLLSSRFNISHEVIEVPWMKSLGRSSLTNASMTVPSADVSSIDNPTVSAQTAIAVWVPNRNGVFLNIAASFAESLGATLVIPGFNIEEAATFPDNGQGFLEATNAAFEFSTANHVRTQCFTLHMNKTQIVRQAMDEKIPFEMMWPCYHAFEKWCGDCESCLRTKRAMQVNEFSTQGYFLKP